MRHAFTITTRHRSGPASASLAVLMMLSPGAGHALTVVDPALEAITFSAEPVVSVALGSAAEGFDAYLYAIARGVSPRIDQLVKFDAAGTVIARSQLALDAAVLAMGAGGYSGRIFAGEFGLPDQATDGAYELHPDGTVTLFSNVGGGNPDLHGIAFGDGGSFGNNVYVANPTAGSSDARANTAIVRLNGDGSVAGNLVSDPAGPFYLAVAPADAKAEYGDYIYYTLLSANRIMRVDAAGNASTFVTLGPDERGVHLAFGIGGAFGNALYVSVVNDASSADHRLVRVLPDGTLENVATGIRGWRLAFDPASMDMFLANESEGIVRIGAPGCASDGPGTLQFTAASRNVSESDGSVEFAVSRSCGTVGEVTVDYLLTAGTAVPTDDYLHPSGGAAPQTDTGTLVFGNGIDLQSIVIGMVDNDVIDGTRGFTVELLVPTGGADLGDPSRLAVSILDDDVGADLEVVSLTFQEITSDIAEFPGLTAGFNDLRYRHRVVAQIRNNGQAAISNFSIELLVPKDHLAGYGQAPGSSCEVLTVDPADPVYVHVACTGLSLDAGASMNLPDAAFYVGYASVVPRNAGYTYSVAVRTLGASVQDINAGNDSRSESLVPRTSSGSRSGGGATSPAWLAVFGLLAVLQWRRRGSRTRVAQEFRGPTEM